MSGQKEQEKTLLTEVSPLSEVLIHFPSKAALGGELNISRQYVSQMDMDSPLPRVYYLMLRYEVRPDLYQAEESAA